MAKIWLCSEGKHQLETCVAEIPRGEAEARLGLSAGQRVSGLEEAGPKFGLAEDGEAWVRGYQHVVVEITASEADNDFQEGYYILEIDAQSAQAKLSI